VHRSYFKSGSKLYDALLYPHFHKKFVKEFHRNMGQLVGIIGDEVTALK